jgi:uncharacterized ferritin-like protein (DUF455 family)
MGQAGPGMAAMARTEHAIQDTGGSLFDALRACLACPDPSEKVRLVNALGDAVADGRLQRPHPGAAPDPIRAPGRPAAPLLVHPRELPQRGLGSAEGRAALLHAVTHIEFNAINLALDAAYRFRDMPPAFHHDWISVAVDEARHFSLLAERLQELGSHYGAFPAHNGLWEMAERTAGSCLARMALVPRVLEARGLDVTPGMIVRLRSLGDQRSAAILEVILAEEVRHVAIGSQWFAWCCERDGLAPEATFIELISGVAKGSLRGPFNLAARSAAGFADSEMALIAALGESK